MDGLLTRLLDSVVRGYPCLHAIEVAVTDYEHKVFRPQGVTFDGHELSNERGGCENSHLSESQPVTKLSLYLEGWVCHRLLRSY